MLQQFVTSLNQASSEVMRVAFGRAPFPADAMQQVVPSYRVRRAAHFCDDCVPACVVGFEGHSMAGTVL